MGGRGDEGRGSSRGSAPLRGGVGATGGVAAGAGAGAGAATPTGAYPGSSPKRPPRGREAPGTDAAGARPASVAAAAGVDVGTASVCVRLRSTCASSTAACSDVRWSTYLCPPQRSLTQPPLAVVTSLIVSSWTTSTDAAAGLFLPHGERLQGWKGDGRID